MSAEYERPYRVGHLTIPVTLLPSFLGRAVVQAQPQGNLLLDTSSRGLLIECGLHRSSRRSDLPDLLIEASAVLTHHQVEPSAQVLPPWRAR